MNRVSMLELMQNHSGKSWDVIVIGGGATGLGCAVDALSRGYDTLLLEASDFAKSTSSKSTKLLHGGVRYMAKGEMKLVREALHERGILFQSARHLARNTEFIIPVYSTFEKYLYTSGLKIYDWLSGTFSLGSSRILSSEEVLAKLPGIQTEGLKGGVLYHDGQFDDARLAINLLQTIGDNQGIAINYMKVEQLMKSDADMVQGVIVRDMFSDKTYSLRAKVVVNATGVFSEAIQKMDTLEIRHNIQASKGVHIVLDASFLPSKSALMIPKTKDGRVLFAIPWYDRIVIGTTDTPTTDITDEPKADAEDIQFILEHITPYLKHTPIASDIKSVFAGLRPLAVSKDHQATKDMSRQHHIQYSANGLVTVLGGKWTTYRKMAEDAINLAREIGNLPDNPSLTGRMSIHGNCMHFNDNDPLHIYGSDADEIRDLSVTHPEWKAPLHPAFSYILAELVWCIRNEMPQTLEDLLSRRTRCVLLDAVAAMDAAPIAAKIMADELGKDDAWVQTEIKNFITIAKNYKASEILA